MHKFVNQIILPIVFKWFFFIMRESFFFPTGLCILAQWNVVGYWVYGPLFSYFSNLFIKKLLNERSWFVICFWIAFYIFCLRVNSLKGKLERLYTNTKDFEWKYQTFTFRNKKLKILLQGLSILKRTREVEEDWE